MKKIPHKEYLKNHFQINKIISKYFKNRNIIKNKLKGVFL